MLYAIKSSVLQTIYMWPVAFYFPMKTKKCTSILKWNKPYLNFGICISETEHLFLGGFSLIPKVQYFEWDFSVHFSFSKRFNAKLFCHSASVIFLVTLLMTWTMHMYSLRGPVRLLALCPPFNIKELVSNYTVHLSILSERDIIVRNITIHFRLAK